MRQEIKRRPDVGAVLLRMLNGLKHTPQTISSLLGINPKELEKIIQGKLGLTEEIEEKLISVRGVNQRDFYPSESQYLFPVKDDTEDGVMICRREDTIKSQRTITRGPDQVPYYIYGDMAMSNLSTIKPEWIKQLFIHDGENADDLPDWAFNKGHFEHQITYFIGLVNFYWIDKNGKRHVRKMNTGDTNYIVPFVPHTFTTRKEDEGMILAITYGGAIADPEFSASLSSLDMEEFLKNASERLPVLSSDALKDIEDGIIVSRHFDAAVFGEKYKGVTVLHLDRLNCQFQLLIFELIFQAGYSRSYNIVSDCWGCVIGDSEILFGWGKDQSVWLKPGDSFFIQAGIPHFFEGPVNGEAKLFIVDHEPKSDDPYTELALIEKYAGEEGLRRVHTETTRWY